MSIDTEPEAPPVPDCDTTRIERQTSDVPDFSPAVILRTIMAEASQKSEITLKQTKDAMRFIDTGDDIVTGTNGSAGPHIEGCIVLRRLLAEALQKRKITPEQGAKIMRFIDRTEERLTTLADAPPPKYFSLETGKQLYSAVGKRLQRLFRWGSAR